MEWFKNEFAVFTILVFAPPPDHGSGSVLNENRDLLNPCFFLSVLAKVEMTLIGSLSLDAHLV